MIVTGIYKACWLIVTTGHFWDSKSQKFSLEALFYPLCFSLHKSMAGGSISHPRYFSPAFKKVINGERTSKANATNYSPNHRGKGGPFC